MANLKIKIWGAFAAAFFIPALAMAAIETTDNTVFRKPPNWCNTDRLGNLTGRDIPYGGFTGGVCGISNATLRVTDRLMGVVASVWDGYDERYQLPNGYHPGDYDYYKTIGCYTNNTTRILDVINVGGYYNVRKTTGEVDPTRMGENPIEEALAYGDHEGLAARFGSRYLDALCGDALPPISPNWQQALPFRRADALAWYLVFPTYEALNYDAHFYTTNGALSFEFNRSHLYDWMSQAQWFQDVVDNAMKDYSYAALDLYDALMFNLPLTNVLEDVLKIDPGWSYSSATSGYGVVEGSADDFTPWRSMTQRLDHKRLGIICQLERHMEHTYNARQREDEALPLVGLASDHRKAWTAIPTNLAFRVQNDADLGAFNVTLLSDLWSPDIAWTLVTNNFTVATNSHGTCYPTARAPKPSLSGLVHALGCYLPIYATDSQLRAAISSAVASAPGHESWTNGTLLATIMPLYFPPGTTPLGHAQLDWTIYEIAHAGSDGGESAPVNVTVATWDFEDGVYYAAASAGDPLLREYWQRASVCYTPRDTGSNVTANLSWESPVWPLRSIWNGGWVKAVEVPNLEALIASSNCPPEYADSTTTAPMPWGELDETNATYRAFRYAELDRSESRSFLERERVRKLDDLNLAVGDKFLDLCGVRPANYIDTYGHLESVAEDALKRSLQAQGGPANLAIIFGEYSYFYVEASVDLNISRVYNVRYDPTTGGDVTNTIPHDAGLGYSAGYMQFDFEYKTNAFPAPQPAAVRVDGHQNQMPKTMWKFRNLGNPDDN